MSWTTWFSWTAQQQHWFTGDQSCDCQLNSESTELSGWSTSGWPFFKVKEANQFNNRSSIL